MLAVLVLFSISANAHEVKEMTARARVFNNRVEMVITVSTHMATVLLADSKVPAMVLTPETIPELRIQLEAKARAFCTLLSAGGKLLAPTSVDVLMANSDELNFYLTYSAVDPSPLRFEMTVLDRLESGNVITLEVLDAARKLLGSKQLKRGESTMEVSVLAKAPESAK